MIRSTLGRTSITNTVASATTKCTSSIDNLWWVKKARAHPTGCEKQYCCQVSVDWILQAGGNARGVVVSQEIHGVEGGVQHVVSKYRLHGRTTNTMTKERGAV